VIPYISLSLITGIGALRYEEVKGLAFKGGAILLVVWAVTLVAILLMPLAFPAWLSATFFGTSLVEEPQAPDFLRLFIPSNPFYSYANALVPAVVVFSALVGVGLIGMTEKAALLKPLSVLRDTLMWVTGVIAKLGPVTFPVGTPGFPGMLGAPFPTPLKQPVAGPVELWARGPRVGATCGPRRARSLGSARWLAARSIGCPHVP
jgi:Na+/H+-dicarboxylate symporter